MDLVSRYDELGRPLEQSNYWTLIHPKVDKPFCIFAVTFTLSVWSLLAVSPLLRSSALLVMNPEIFSGYTMANLVSLDCGREHWIGYHVDYARHGGKKTLHGGVCLTLSTGEWSFVPDAEDPIQ